MIVNNPKTQEYMSVKEASEIWGITESKIIELYEQGKIANTAKLDNSLIISKDSPKPVIESELQQKTTPKNKIQATVVEMVERGKPFTVSEHKIGKTTFIVTSTFPRQGRTIDESLASLVLRKIEGDNGFNVPIKDKEKLLKDIRKNSTAAKISFDDEMQYYRKKFLEYGFSDEETEVLMKKVEADYEPFEV